MPISNNTVVRNPSKRIKQLRNEFSIIFDKAPVGIAYIRDLKIARVNPFFANLFQYDIKKFRKRNARFLFSSTSDYDDVFKVCNAVLDKGENYKGQHVFKRSDGSFFWGSVTINPINKKDLTEGYILILQDITQTRHYEEELEKRVIARTSELEAINQDLQTEIEHRQKTELELKENRERLSHILELVLTGIIIIDNETHRITYVNQLAEVITGYTKKQLIGFKCFETICPRLDKVCIVDNLLTDECRNIESVYKNIKGDEIPVIKNVRTITIDARKYNIESFIDIREIKRKEEIIIFKDKITSALVQSINILLHTTSLETSVISAAISSLGQVLNANKVSIIRVKAFNPLHMDTLLTWQNPTSSVADVNHFPFIAQYLENTERDDVNSLLFDGQTIVFDRDQLQSLHFNFNFILCPVVIENICWGFIGFELDASNWSWTSVELSILETVCRTLGITIRRLRIEQTLRESETKYKAIFEDSFTGMLVIDPKTLNILDCNHSVLELMQYTHNELINTSIYSLIPQKHHTHFDEWISNVTNVQVAHREKAHYITKSGISKYVEVQAKYIEYMGQQAYLIMTQDQTEIYELEKQLEIKEQETKAQLKKEIATFQSEIREMTQQAQNTLAETSYYIKSVTGGGAADGVI